MSFIPGTGDHRRGGGTSTRPDGFAAWLKPNRLMSAPPVAGHPPLHCCKAPGTPPSDPPMAQWCCDAQSAVALYTLGDDDAYENARWNSAHHHTTSFPTPVRCCWEDAANADQRRRVRSADHWQPAGGTIASSNSTLTPSGIGLYCGYRANRAVPLFFTPTTSRIAWWKPSMR